MSELGTPQKERLASAFSQIDALLDEAAAIVGAEGWRRPSAQRPVDLTPLQRQRVAQAASQLRAVMMGIAARHGATLPSAGRSAAQACEALIERAVVLAEALGPRQMNGDGRLSDESEAELHRIVAELFEPLERMRAALMPVDVPATSDGGLGELRRVVQAHGLVALRPRLADLVEHAAAGDLRIAVFGRVNAGKSSLLNHLLGTDVLPTGATPVTAVPVLLRHGLRARGLAEFADAAPDVFTPGRLAEFAAEHFNAGNTKHLTRLSMELSAARLRGGITLIDTPGLSSGPTDVPACDIGLVLLDATGDLSLAEAGLAAELHRSATEVLILLGKSDLLCDTDRWRVFGHVSERLTAGTGIEFPIYFASSRSVDASLRDDWVVRGLDPRLARRRLIVDASLRLKTLDLREAVVQALQRCLASLPRGDVEGVVHGASARAAALLEAAIAHPPWATDEAGRQSRRLVREVAHNAAVIGRHGDDDALDLAPMIAASLQARAAAAAKDVVRELESLAAQCSEALSEAGGRPLENGFEIGPAPGFDAASQLPSMPLRLPWFRWAGHWGVRWSIGRALRRHGVRELAASRLGPCLSRLGEWRKAELARMKVEIQVRQDQTRGEAQRIERDLDALRGPQQPAVPVADDVPA